MTGASRGLGSAIAPGITHTDMNAWLRDNETGQRAVAAMTALGRVGESADTSAGVGIANNYTSVGADGTLPFVRRARAVKEEGAVSASRVDVTTLLGKAQERRVDQQFLVSVRLA